MALRILLNDKVFLKDGTEGTVKFIGELTSKGKTIYYGIDLTKGNGKHKGIWENKEYFKTKGNKKNGIFVKKSQIKNTKSSCYIYI